MNTTTMGQGMAGMGNPQGVSGALPRGRRWEPWPVGLIAFFAVFIAGVATFIAYAVSQRMDLVRPDYYEEEIRYQVQLGRLQRTRELGASAGIACDAARRQVRVWVPVGHVAAGLKGSVTLYRPSDARSDRSLPMAPSATGEQGVSLEGLGTGLWRVRVRWESGGWEYHMEEALALGR